MLTSAPVSTKKMIRCVPRIRKRRLSWGWPGALAVTSSRPASLTPRHRASDLVIRAIGTNHLVICLLLINQIATLHNRHASELI